MQKQRIWGFPWLCLCLFLPLYWASCTAKHILEAPLNVKANKTSPADTVWYMEVKLIPGGVIYGMPLNILDIAQPYDLLSDFDLGNTSMLVLRYRFADELQLQDVKNRLLATGRVADITIIINSY